MHQLGLASSRTRAFHHVFNRFRRWRSHHAAASPYMADLVLSHVSELSVLDDPEKRAQLRPFNVAGRSRLATCSGATWFAGHHVAVVNLFGMTLRVYRFYPESDDGPSARLELLHELTENVSHPEDVAVTPDGKLMATTHTITDDLGILLHTIDDSLAPSPGETIRRGTRAEPFHGITFSPDGRHVVFTHIGEPGYIEVVNVEQPFRPRACLLENRHVPLKPKAVTFTADGRFAAVAWAPNPQLVGTGPASAGMLTLHRFDMRKGVIEADPIAELRNEGDSLAIPECCEFIPGENKPFRILVTNHASDTVTAFAYDAETSSLVYTGVVAAGLSFPHGLGVSADGKYLAVANYGDDTLRILRLRAATGRAAA